MEISKGVEMLHLDFHGNIIHPILLWDREMAVLIDTGFPGQIEDLRVFHGKGRRVVRQTKSCDFDTSGCGSHRQSSRDFAGV